MKIGNYSFIAMAGPVGPYGNMVEDETRPGLDGHTFRLMGKRGTPFTMTTSQTFNSAAAAGRAILDYEKLMGTFQVIKDAHDVSYRKCMILSVNSSMFPIAASTDGKDYLIKSTWNIKRAG